MYGKEIKAQRKLRGITQKELAEGTQIPQQTISWIEQEDNTATLYEAVKIADFYGIQLDELIGREVIPNDLKQKKQTKKAIIEEAQRKIKLRPAANRIE